jgi:hypothetical protein
MICVEDMFIYGLRYDPLNDSYHHDMEGNGVICSAVDNLPTEFAKEVKYSDPGISFLLYINVSLVHFSQKYL